MAVEGPAGVGAKAPTKPMKIYFCDICNESIPLKDINSNRITIEDGKIFCSQCAPKKAQKGERVPPVLLAALLVLLVGLATLGVLGSTAKGRLEQAVGDTELRVQSLVGQQSDQAESLERITGRLEEILRKVDDLSGVLARLEQRLDGRIGALEKTEARHFEELKTDMDVKIRSGVGPLDVRLRDLERQATEVQQTLSAASLMQQQIEKRIDLLQDVVSSAGPAKPTARAAPDEAAESDPAETPGEPSGVMDDVQLQEIGTLVKRLELKDPGERFSALVALGGYRDRAAVVTPPVERMLKDPVDYVRKTAVRVLSQLASKSSIPNLIEALRDSDYFVRAAARDALRALAGTGFGFDPDGNPSDRERKIKDWEKWWEINKASIAGS